MPMKGRHHSTTGRRDHAIVIPQIFAHHQSNVRRLALVGVVQARPLHEEPRVRQGVAHAFCSCPTQERAHARRESQVYSCDGALERSQSVIYS